MTEHEIAPPLAVALARRGYQTLTAVQQAVLGADMRGRDLLVSAQTGSGKTVAFGIAIAPDLLDADGTLPEGPAPLAIAIAPTRELALQVAAELGWLYAGTGARVATCVGGMDYRAERNTLARGAQIVVGTPGRLRDHIERGNLDLTALRVAVLDEADEMLDLGFRADLEFILGAAPGSRRTLMFSATLPAAIETLARDFQRDARRVVATGEARQHGDITYRALSVAPRDRENAIFNLLRLHEARTAIVFCKTRANVSHLLARMGNRGFRAVALSGDLSQTERTHALQALRDGRARVCIATDVAARGIDLPGLELVIHADLPGSPETLLHRSGRTGRAGAKGVSALIVAPSDYKKAQRLLQGAKVAAEWGKAPSADEVRARDDRRMMDHPSLTTPLDDMTIARDLLARVGAEQIAAAFVQLWRDGRPAPEELAETPAPPDAATRAPRDFGPSVWFTLSVGHAGRAEARWLLPKLCEAGGITRDAIGAIRIRERETHVQIAAAKAPRFGAALEIEPGLMMLRSDGEPAPDAERAARGKPPRQGAPRKPGPAGKTPAKAATIPASEPAARAQGERKVGGKPRPDAAGRAGTPPPAPPLELGKGKPDGTGTGKPGPGNGKPRRGKGRQGAPSKGRVRAPRPPRNGSRPPRRPKGGR